MLKTRRLYRFGCFSLDAAAKVLLKDGEPVRLARRSVETLLAMVENSGQVLTKEELMSAVWPDRVVAEANLAQNVAVVRRALGVERGEPGYIETFPGRGYRIIGPVTAADETIDASHPQPLSAAPTLGVRSRWRLIALAAVVGFAALWLARRGAPPLPREEPRRAPVTRLAGQEYQPAISADGTKVAFVWEPEGPRGAGIWVREPGKASPWRVTSREGSYSSPAWSPDGRRLAYLRFGSAAGEIVVAEADGREERVVAKVFPSRYGLPNRHLDWSPDGRFLAIDDAESGKGEFAVFLLSLATGEKRRLTSPDRDIIGDIDPRFSPNGNTISFIRAYHRAWQELFTVPVTGGQPRQITADMRQVSGQAWMPDGRTLVFGSDRSGEFRLWKAPHGGAFQSTGIYGDFPMQLSISLRAPVLVYTVLQHDLNIWRLDLRAREESEERWSRIVASSGQDASPQYSPAGDRICFRSDRSGEEQLWVSDPDGSNPVQVTTGSLRPSVGRWSPDGRAIVFNNPRSREIFVTTMSGDGAWRVRALGVAGIHPIFSPDAHWIYAGREDSIVRIPAQGGAASEVVHMRGISLGMAPDGKHIYFVRESSGSTLWRVDAGSGQASRVLDGLVPYCTSCWASTSAGIYYLGTKPGARDRQALYFHEFATGRERTLTDYPEPVPPIGSGPFSLSPDGRYLLCVRLDPSNSDVFRVEPFR
jgi:Tol biopolymer transport system component/DNA-binding winged helix-turn-helix (wHTH) protein